VLKFDSKQGTWSEVVAMPAARDTFAACAVGSAIYVFGGYDEDAGIHDSVFKYDTVANEWSTLAPMPIACINHSASLLGGMVYITGAGDDGGDLRFDPASGTWSTLTPTSIGRYGGVSFVLGDCLYVTGGRERYASVERYDENTDTWTTMADMLEGRRIFRAVTTKSAGPAEEQDLFDLLIAKATREGV
jgi:N-acetylneuraminic acid mutarotase